jgi:hypothetical protein
MMRAKSAALLVWALHRIKSDVLMSGSGQNAKNSH